MDSHQISSKDLRNVREIQIGKARLVEKHVRTDIVIKRQEIKDKNKVRRGKIKNIDKTQT